MERDPGTQVRLLGPPAVWHDDAWTEPRFGKAAALLFVLARRGGWVPREEALLLLWPEASEERARTNLRKLLSRDVRELPWAAGLEREDTRLRWAVATDVAAFEAALYEGRWARAVELYRGELLEGVRADGLDEYATWLEGERRELHRGWRKAAFRLDDDLREAGRPTAAADVLERVAASDPLDEEVHRRWLRALAAGGRRNEALDAHAAFRARLEEELGGEPEEATLRLVEELARAPAGSTASHPDTSPPAAPPADPAAAAPAPAATPFVAREAELTWLDARLGETLAGGPRVAFVAGDAGQGKTALLQAFARRARAAHPELLVADGSGNAYVGAGDPYLPFREALALLAGDVEARLRAGLLAPELAARLERHRPAFLRALREHGPDLVGPLVPAGALAPVSAGSGPASPRASEAAARPIWAVAPSGTGGVHGQGVLFSQVARVLQELTRRAPLLLVLDDLQWVDPGSAGLLLHLAKHLRGHPVLLLGAYRPAEIGAGQDGARHPLEPVLNECRRDFGEVVLDLGRAEDRAFVEALLDAEPNRLPESFRATLARQTGGHPLFTVELLRALQERGDLARDAQGRWTARDELAWDTLPARVEGAIRERVERLPPEHRELLQVAAVEGEEFTAEVAARALGRDPRDVARVLSGELDRRHRLVRALEVRQDGASRLSRYRFRHHLIQHYLYGTLDAVERTYLHEGVGTALEGLLGERAEAEAVGLAYHFRRAGVHDRAARYLRLAGDAAWRAAALEEAAGHYRAALEHLPENGPAPRAELLRRLGDCLWVLNHVEEAREVYGRASELYEAAGDIAGVGAMQRQIGRTWWELGDRARSLEHYRRALARLEAAPGAEASREFAWAVSAMSQMHMLAAEYDDAIAQGERALALAERLGARDVAAHALNNVGTSLVSARPERQEEGLAMLERSARLSRELHLYHDASRAMHNLAENLIALGRFARAREVALALLEESERVHNHGFALTSRVDLASVDWHVGRWREALRWRDEAAVTIASGPVPGMILTMIAIVEAHVLNDLGRPEAARARLASIEAVTRSLAEQQTTLPWLDEALRAAEAMGDDAAAEAAAREALELVEASGHVDYHCGPALLHAACWWSTRGTPEALAAARRALAQLNRLQASSPGAHPVAGPDEVAALLARAEGDLAGAASGLERAVARWRAGDLPLDEARALLELSRTLRAAGDAAGARAAAARGAEIVDRLAAELGDEDRASFLAAPLATALATALREATG